MNVLGLVVAAWLGFNAAFAVVMAVLTRNDKVHRDIHDLLDATRSEAAD